MAFEYQSGALRIWSDSPGACDSEAKVLADVFSTHWLEGTPETDVLHIHINERLYNIKANTVN